MIVTGVGECSCLTAASSMTASKKDDRSDALHELHVAARGPVMVVAVVVVLVVVEAVVAVEVVIQAVVVV